MPIEPTTAITLFKTAYEASKKAMDIADRLGEVELKAAIVELKEKLLELRDENFQLREQLSEIEKTQRIKKILFSKKMYGGCKRVKIKWGLTVVPAMVIVKSS